MLPNASSRHVTFVDPDGAAGIESFSVAIEFARKKLLRFTLLIFSLKKLGLRDDFEPAAVRRTAYGVLGFVRRHEW
jgi:hypothetical protein